MLSEKMTLICQLFIGKGPLFATP